ncbi:MAG: UDP-2,3-diacylglucosamine diphosphatase [Ichthyobacteriaceae bacterium]|nr:UDP-2,3-diacylglucosamine diphosphatase [Ichthyobacteriaceae bacterium]
MVGNKIYFASDQHFGVPNLKKSQDRERLFVKWLEMAEKDATHIFILGDMFDFWFEYKTVVPRGYTRVLGKLASLTDKGIPVTFFVGNHDLWMRDYFETELGVEVNYEPKVYEFFNKKFYLGHGDGLGPNDEKYKLLKKVFTNPLAQWLFARFHPNFALGLANYFSRKSRLANGEADQTYNGDDSERLYQYTIDMEKEADVDYFVFGHRHLAMIKELPLGAKYVNTGEWVSKKSYAVFADGDIELKNFKL